MGARVVRRASNTGAEARMSASICSRSWVLSCSSTLRGTLCRGQGGRAVIMMGMRGMRGTMSMMRHDEARWGMRGMVGYGRA